eukprot:SAG31_NODE_810_length_11919_cov_4.480924_11_plen_178_part_00
MRCSIGARQLKIHRHYHHAAAAADRQQAALSRPINRINAERAALARSKFSAAHDHALAACLISGRLRACTARERPNACIARRVDNTVYRAYRIISYRRARRGVLMNDVPDGYAILISMDARISMHRRTRIVRYGGRGYTAIAIVYRIRYVPDTVSRVRARALSSCMRRCAARENKAR